MLGFEDATGGTGCLSAGRNDIVDILTAADPGPMQHLDLGVDRPDGCIYLGNDLAIVGSPFSLHRSGREIRR